ncbi:MAG: twin-arginine translocase subunit TatB [Beijerinckiaceae bacterium]|nr:twin-arginine translocase subunit TatB [Beijerinckiaceae bacterium]
MFDIGASELLVIGVVALVVIGPKELPGVLRTVGKTVGKVRQMAGEFQSQFSEAMREAEMDEARKKVADIGDSVKSALDPDASSTPSANTTTTVTPEAEINAASVPDLAPPLPEPAHASHEAIMAELNAPAPQPAEPSAAPPALNTESVPPKAAGHA